MASTCPIRRETESNSGKLMGLEFQIQQTESVWDVVGPAPVVLSSCVSYINFAFNSLARWSCPVPEPRSISSSQNRKRASFKLRLVFVVFRCSSGTSPSPEAMLDQFQIPVNQMSAKGFRRLPTSSIVALISWSHDAGISYTHPKPLPQSPSFALQCVAVRRLEEGRERVFGVRGRLWKAPKELACFLFPV